MPHIMTAGLDDLIPVVIIITVIIARIMKATKGAKPLVPPPPDSSGEREPSATGDELREFLEALSGTKPPRPTPPPAPPPVPQPQPVIPPQPQRPAPAPVHARKWTRPRQGKRATAAPTPAPKPAPAPRPVRKPVAPRVARRPVTVEACELSTLRKALDDHLSDRQSLRGAWLLREVLGPPVGLRH
jgi:hypothetical protein